MGQNIKNTLKEAGLGLLVIGALIGGTKYLERFNEQKQDRSRLRMLSAIDTINQSVSKMKGTNDYVTVKSGQEFLDKVGINYKLGSNEVVTLDISMGHDWDDVYVGVRNKFAQGGGIIPGITTTSNLHQYLYSRQK